MLHVSRCYESTCWYCAILTGMQKHANPGGNAQGVSYASASPTLVIPALTKCGRDREPYGGRYRAIQRMFALTRSDVASLDIMACKIRISEAAEKDHWVSWTMGLIVYLCESRARVVSASDTPSGGVRIVQQATLETRGAIDKSGCIRLEFE